MQYSKRARAALARYEQRRNAMRILIERRPDGTYDIQSAFPGPLSTIAELEKVIATLRGMALNQELQAAAPSVAIPNPQQARELVNGKR